MRQKIFIVIIVLFSIPIITIAQLQPQALQQIQLLLQEKGSRTLAQQRIDSRLLQAVREKRGQQMVSGVALEPAKVNANVTGDLKVDISAKVSDDLIGRIEALGGTIIYASLPYNTIRALVNLSSIETIAGYPEVSFIEPAVLSTHGNGMSGSSEFKQQQTLVQSKLLFYLLTADNSSQIPYSGTVTSEGDRTHRADDARNTFGYSGQGIKVGVLSDSYNALGTAAADVASGNLPGTGNPLGNTTPVTVVQDFTGGSDEGRAMLQIVHDVAPKAQLFFATADVSEAGFATNILTLRNTYNCDIIIDDVSYFDEPVFQDGPVAQAVNTVTASGALYFSSAGNAGSVKKGTAGYYEGDFNSTGSPTFTYPGTVKKIGAIHNFNTPTATNGDIITVAGDVYTLNWADPLKGSTNDYDLFLVSSAGTVKGSSTNIQNGTQNPYEAITPPATLAAGDRLVVFKANAAQVRAFALNGSRGTLTVVTTGQTHAHGSAVNAFSVAATPAMSPGPYPAAFNATDSVETFSSDGPRRVFYNADGTAITAGNFLFSTNGGTVRNKPDITAADGVSTTLPGTTGLNPFYGTSAAAPHAGAIAALIKSANPALTTAQIRTVLTSTALDIEGAGYDINSGYGIVQAYQAMQSVNPAPVSNIILGTVTPSEGSFSNKNGGIDPGELANLVIQLDNPAILTATNVSATLSTTTSGIIISKDSVVYDNIPGGGSASNTNSPFQFGINSSVPCGTVINFILKVNFSGGPSPQTFFVNVTVGNQPGGNITSSLGSTPPNGPGFTSTSGQQTSRLSRGADAGTCAVPLTNPGLLSTATGNRQYDAYLFTNTTTISQCVNVTMTSTNGTNLYTASYNDSGFVPSNPSTHFLSDPGQSVISQQYSFTAPPSKKFTVVVHDVNVVPASGSQYTLDVSLSACTNGPACTPDTITTVPVIFDGKGIAYSQPFAATGGSGSYLFSLTGALPAGLTFSGNTLSGTPTQTGSFPITITTSDAAGCPAAIQKDTITIVNPVVYTFTGNGNWDVPSNWLDDLVPPATLITGSQIIIDPVPGGQCILNVPYTLSAGSTITVDQTKNFVIEGNLTIHQ